VKHARIACVDVDYRDGGAVAAAVAFRGFDAEASLEEVTAPVARVAPYEPGRFYLRELPCVRAALGALGQPPEIVIVDGYVWLGEGVPGLGARLFDELRQVVPVIGVAKKPFRGCTLAIAILRGQSGAPLFVTAAGVDAAAAAGWVRGMHGPHRIPTLLKRADMLCREAHRR
jgi:deoxyribonuclease V